MDVPLPFGLVSGHLYAAVGDTADVGRNQDLVGLTGTATFKGTITKEVVTGSSPMIILPQAISADIVDGVLLWLGEANVPLTASVGLGWQWKVSFTNLRTPDDTAVTLLGWNLDVKVYDANAALDQYGRNPTITDLTESSPVVPPAGNVQLAKGDKGDKGDTGLAAVNNYVGITQTAYNALVAAGTVNATTLYLITGP